MFLRSRSLRFRLASAFLLAPIAVAQQAGELGQRVDAAVARGTRFLIESQARDGSWPAHAPRYRRGGTAFVAYALSKTGMASDHPTLQRARAYLEARPPVQSYALGSETLLLAQLGNVPDAKRIKDLTQQLLEEQIPHGWTYPVSWKGTHWEPDNPDRGDLSNMHFAVFALDAAERSGVKLPKKFWSDVADSILLFQERPHEVEIDGESRDAAGFLYTVGADEPPRSAMTSAAVAMLALCRGRNNERLGPGDRRRIEESAELARAWLDKNFKVDENIGSPFFHYYNLLCLERAADLYGWESIGGRDWYAAGADWILAQQRGDGGWHKATNEELAHPDTDTAMAMLF